MTEMFRFLWVIGYMAVLASACNPGVDSADTVANQPTAELIILPLDTLNGLAVNAITGDSIRPLINANGDTISTGQWLPMLGIRVNPDSLGKPTVIKVALPEPIMFLTNRTELTDTAPTGLVIDSLLVRVAVNNLSSKHQYINGLGDTLITGRAFALVTKTVEGAWPASTPALPMRMKDNATHDLQYLDVDQGMNSSYVWSVLNDRVGNLWMANNGGGASRYDGQSFTHFTENEGMSSNLVKCLMQDRTGRLWFGTNGGGITRFDGQHFEHINMTTGLTTDRIWAMLEDSKGNVWVGTNGAGVSRISGDSITHYTMSEGLISNRVWAIDEDAQGNIWFGTNGGGACRFDGTTFTHFTDRQGLTSNKVWSICSATDGTTWFGTNGGGLFRIDGQQFKQYAVGQGLTSNIIWDVMEDSEGRIWCATNGGGICCIDGKTVHRYTVEEGLTSNIARSLTEDSSGMIWAGTDGGGVARFNGRTFSTMTRAQGLASNVVWSMAQDRSGNHWFGSDVGGAIQFNGTSFIHHNIATGLTSNYITALLPDTNGEVWIGTNGSGVCRFNGKEYLSYTERNGLPSGYVAQMMRDGRGSLWFATSGGLACMSHDTSVVQYTEATGLTSNKVGEVVEDIAGNIWFGTDGGGVSRFNGTRVQHITEREGLPHARVSAMLCDRTGRMWVGTKGGGMCAIFKNQITYINERVGLSSNFVWSILEDTTAKPGSTVLWVSTEKGMNRIELPDAGQPLITVFGNVDGLKALDFYLNSAMIDAQGRAWWGSGKGIISLDLGRYRPPSTTPSVLLKQLDVNGQLVDFRHLTDSLEGAISFASVQPFLNYPNQLVLPFRRNHLTFHFVGIDWNSPYALRYSYRMIGLSDDWSPPMAETKADYRNLPYGTYTFEVRTIGAAQVWSQSLTYTFTLLPPWWHTWWARLGYALVAVLLVYLFVAWRTRSLRLRQRELENTVTERTADVVREKAEVERKNHEMLESINYAQRLQEAVMPNKTQLAAIMPESFLLFEPRDIVSGDFYWMERKGGIVYLAVGDCTGHGVPGAMLSVIGLNSLNRCINDLELTRPKDVLMQMTIDLLLAFEGSIATVRDGMDLALCAIDLKKMTITYSGANNSIWIARQDKMLVLKADRRPVGFHDLELAFTQTNLPIQKGDTIYLASDGFHDQMGGPQGKKYMSKKFRELVLRLSALPMAEQERALSAELAAWKGDNPQTDDVCVMGVRVN